MRYFVHVAVAIILFFLSMPQSSFARTPNKLSGIRLGWSLSTAHRNMKRKKWKLSLNKKRGCKISRMYKDRRGTIVSLSFYRGRVYQITKMLPFGGAKRYTPRGWGKRLRFLSKKYGKPKIKTVGRTVFWRWVTKRRWFSLSGKVESLRLIKVMIYNLKDRRRDRLAARCR